MKCNGDLRECVVLGPLKYHCDPDNDTADPTDRADIVRVSMEVILDSCFHKLYLFLTKVLNT